MRKQFLRLMAVSLLLVVLAGSALAHDGWIQTSSPVVRTGEVAYVDLQFGNHSNEHSSYRIAGKWSMSTSKVYAIAPDGSKYDITANVFDTGEADDVSPAGAKGYYAAAFVPGTHGAYVIAVEGDSIFKHGETASRTLRSAKTFLAAADIPVAERVASLTGFSRPVATDRAELIPLVNPAAITAGSQVRIQLTHAGKPVAGEHVTVIRRSVSEGKEYTTDENGMITIDAASPDFYLVRAKFDKLDENKVGEYDKTSYEATMTFVVQRGGQAAPVAGSQPTTVWVNGAQLALTTGDGLPEVLNGRTFLPIRAVAEALGAEVAYDATTETVSVTRGDVFVQLRIGAQEATVNGRVIALDAPAYVSGGRSMVPLRFLAEAMGATVEYMPAYAGVGAAVLVYLGK